MRRFIVAAVAFGTIAFPFATATAAEVDPGPKPAPIRTTERVTAVFCNDYNWAVDTTTTDWELRDSQWVKGRPSTTAGKWHQRKSTPADWRAAGIADICAPAKKKPARVAPAAPRVAPVTNVAEVSTPEVAEIVPLRAVRGVWVEVETT